MAPAAAAAGDGHELQPHAVVVPWPGQGHLNPLLHFARQLVWRAGFRITVVNLEYMHAQVMRARQQARGDVPAEEEEGGMIRFVAVPDGLPRGHQTRTSDVPALCRALDGIAPALERLIADTQPPVTCIVSDSHASLTQNVANTLRLPRVAFWTQSATSYALHVFATELARSTRPHDIISSFSSLPGVPAPLQLHDLNTFLQPFDPSDYMFDFVTRPFLPAHEADLVVLNTFDDLEGDVLAALQERFQPRHCAGRLLTVGPVQSLNRSTATHPSSLWPEDQSCLEWLDTHPASSVVYVAFGSQALFSEKQLHELARGLEECGRPFLWVLRPGTLASGSAQDEEYAALLPASFMERVRGRGLVIGWAPQMRVLAHQSVGGFLTHGGWNSVLEGIAHGLPLLGFSYSGDQMLTCRCIADVWRDGLSLDTSDVATRPLSRSDVAAKVAAMMDDRDIRQRALSLRDAARRAVAAGGSSSTNLERAIHTLLDYISIQENS